MLWENLLCVGLPKRGMDFAGVPILGRGPGAICSLRTGDSGRCSEGLDFFIRLGVRPGPGDLLGWVAAGVGGVKLVEFWVPAFKPPVADTGLMGKELVAEFGGESRLTALLSGRKMPAPDMLVVK